MLRLTVLFVVTQVLGIAVATNLIGMLESGELETTGIVTENPEDIENAIGLIAYILASTVLFLILLYFFKGALIFKILETFVVFMTSALVFSMFFPSAEFVLAILLVSTRIFLSKSLLLRNMSATISVAAVGAIIGTHLGVFPVLLFIILLSIYDFIAVFKTKHMVTLAKGITKKNLAFTFAIPSPELEHQFELGTGDMVIPLTFAASVMNASAISGVSYPMYLIPGAMILLASLAGLLWTIDYSSKNVGKALPALPPQTVLMILMWGLLKLAGF